MELQISRNHLVKASGVRFESTKPNPSQDMKLSEDVRKVGTGGARCSESKHSVDLPHPRPEEIMTRARLIPVTAALIGNSALIHDEKFEVKRRVVSATDIAEKFDGKESKATVVEATLEPGQESVPHRHPGPVFGYVLEGEYEHAINDEPAKVLKAGETFYEPVGCLHRFARNPGTVMARVLATIVHPRDAKSISTPEHKK